MERNQLVRLVKDIQNPHHDATEVMRLLTQLRHHVPHPGIPGLIFWPETYGLGDTPDPEAIVDTALAYQPTPV